MIWDLQKRQDLVLGLTNQFHEKPNQCSPWHQQVITHWQTHRFEEAVRACRESYRLGLEMAESYVRAASRFYLGLTYFLQSDGGDWDRAANACEESAKLFHGLSERDAEGVAWLAVGRIADVQCEIGDDRWHRALSAYLRVSAPLAESSNDLVEIAQQAYEQVIAKSNGHGQQTPSGAQPASASVATAPRPVAIHPTPSASARTRPVPRPSDAKRRQFSSAILIIGLLVMMNILLGILAVSILLTTFPAVVLALFVGIVIGLLATLVQVLIFGVAGQLIYNLPDGYAAVVQYRNRTWVIKESGHHCVLPFVERLRAFVPLAPTGTDIFFRRLATSDGFAFAARGKVRYNVSDVQKLWTLLNPVPKPKRFWEIERPDPSEQVRMRTEILLRGMLERGLLKLANDVPNRALLGDKRALGGRVKNLIAEQSTAAGLQLSEVFIEPYFC